MSLGGRARVAVCTMENLVGGGLYISPDQDASTKPGEGVCPVQNRTEPNYF